MPLRKHILNKTLVFFLCLIASLDAFAQKHQSVNQDSCFEPQVFQLENLMKEYFKYDVVSELQKNKKKIYLSLTTTVKDTFSFRVVRYDTTMFKRQEIKGFEEYVKKNGRFSYCFIIDGCPGVGEEGESEITKEEWYKHIDRLYGEPTTWMAPLPYIYRIRWSFLKNKSK